MNRARWEQIKALKPAPPRFIHVSMAFVRNPIAILAKETGLPYFGQQFVRHPDFNKGGKTYRVAA